MKNGFKIVSLEKRIAQARMRGHFGAGDIRASEKLAEKLKNIGQVSQWTEQSKNDNFNFQNVNDVLPRDEDYIYVNFRALSKVIVEGHWLDWTGDGVLEAGVSMLQGATIYPNHNFFDVNNWLGSVSNSAWDAAGANAGGVPGINAEYKIDALMNPRIARGLLMKPPAIHSTSLTVLFEFDYSHPRLVEEGKFWVNLGEDIDGEIVRLIVTGIREIWEASLVFQGADRLAKQTDDDEDDEEETEDFENRSAARLSAKPTNSNEEKTMKIEKTKRAELGIEFDGEDVPESEIFKAAESLAAKNKQFDGVNLSELQSKAGQVETLLTAKRAEVSRLAKIAELGAAEGELDEIVSQTIDDADAEKLVKLETYYVKKAAGKFPAEGRSSFEASDEVETAGGVKTGSQTPAVSTGGLV